MRNRQQLYTRIAREGQRYLDEAVYKIFHPKPELISPIAQAVAQAFGSTVPQQIRILTGYNRVTLRWMKPGPHGQLVPK